MGAHDRCEDRTVERTALGRSGIEVSRLILGCGNFGGIGSSPAFFGQGESEEQAAAVMDAAWAAGITTFDTADAYGGGRSETFIGNWIRSRGVRPVLTTKTFNPMSDGADSGLSRERIRRQLESSLERLGVERIDLYLSHAMDPATPVEETAAAFDELRREGTISAWGGSNVDAAWIETARPAWVQNSYSLLDRADEGSVIPLCLREGIGYSPFSPLAGGWLTGKYRRDEPPPAGSRMTLRPGPYEHLQSETTFDALESFEALARTRETTPATLAVAWLLAQPHVTAVVVGPRSPAQLQPALDALELRLSPHEADEIATVFE
jgi:aryl-alcohol dehydrogenase-like predicted oxidoreductase